MIRRRLLRIIGTWQSSPTRPRGHCVFEPTCSEYARQALTELGLVRAFALIVWRLLRCTPLSRGGLDPVPVTGHRRPVKEPA